MKMNNKVKLWVTFCGLIFLTNCGTELLEPVNNEPDGGTSCVLDFFYCDQGSTICLLDAYDPDQVQVCLEEQLACANKVYGRCPEGTFEEYNKYALVRTCELEALKTFRGCTMPGDKCLVEFDFDIFACQSQEVNQNGDN